MSKKCTDIFMFVGGDATKEERTGILSVVYTPSDTTETGTVKWSSDDTSVAKVDASGLVTSVSEGQTTVRCAWYRNAGDAEPAFTAACTAWVFDITFKKDVTGVSLDQKAMTVETGGTGRLTAEVQPADATDGTVKWMSSDPETATVDPNGTVHGMKEGKVTIYVLTQDGGFRAECMVTVQPPAQPVTPSGGGENSSSSGSGTVTPAAAGTLLATDNYKVQLNSWGTIIHAENSLTAGDVTRYSNVSGITVLQVRNAQRTDGNIPVAAVLGLPGKNTSLQLLLGGGTAMTFLSKADNSGFRGLNVLHSQTFGTQGTYLTKTVDFKNKAMFGTAAIFVTSLPKCLPGSWVSVYIEVNGKNVLFTTLQADQYGNAAMLINATAKYIYVYEDSRT